MATSEKESGDQQIIEGDVINGMDLAHDILIVLERHGVTKEQRTEAYWIFLAGEYCQSLIQSNWTKQMIVEDIEKHRSVLEENIAIMIAEAETEKIKQLAEERKQLNEKRRPTYVG